MCRRIKRRAGINFAFPSSFASALNAVVLPDPGSPSKTYTRADRKSDSLRFSDCHWPSRHSETVLSTGTMGILEPEPGRLGQELVEGNPAGSYHVPFRAGKAGFEIG